MATGATEFLIVSTTDEGVDNFVPEIWSKGAIVARESALVFARLVSRAFEKELTFGDTIHVTSLSDLTAQNKTQEGAISYENNDETNVDITIDQWKYAAIAIESFAKVQVNRDMLEAYSGKMGYALALNVDNALSNLVDGATNNVGTMGVENSDDELLRARQYLNDANVPMDGRNYVFSAAAETGLLKLDRFVHNDYSAIHGEGTRELAVEKAYIANFYRIPCYVSTAVEGDNSAGHDNTLLQTDALALVMQIEPKVHAQFDIDYLVDKVVMEQVYGIKEMRDDHQAWVKGA